MNRREFIGRTAGVVSTAVGLRVWAETTEGKPDSVVGRVFFDGDAPEPPIIDCRADWYCHQVNQKKPLREEDLLVGKDGGLQNVFVSVKSGLPADSKWPVPEKEVKLAHVRCKFVPHVFGIMVNQPLEVINTDRTLENTHGLCEKNKTFNFNQPRRGMKRRLKLDKPESFKIKCDVHPWEGAYCHVMTHPFFAVTDKDGKFAIERLPAGEYELEFRHEKLGVQTKKITVAKGKAAKVEDVKFKPVKRKKLTTTRTS